MLRAGLPRRRSSPSTTPGRAMRARAVSSPTSAPTGSPPSAPGRASRVWLSWAGCSAARRAMSSTTPRSPICAAPICRRPSSTGSPAMLRGLWLARGMDGPLARARPCRSAGPPDPVRPPEKRRCGGGRRGACSDTRWSSPTTPASSVSATTRCAGSTPSASSKAPPRQRRTSQGRGGGQADDLVVLSALEGLQARADPGRASILRARSSGSSPAGPATPLDRLWRDCSGARRSSCACSAAPKSRYTPTDRKTTSDASSPSARSPAARSARGWKDGA